MGRLSLASLAFATLWFAYLQDLAAPPPRNINNLIFNIAVAAAPLALAVKAFGLSLKRASLSGKAPKSAGDQLVVGLTVVITFAAAAFGIAQLLDAVTNGTIRGRGGIYDVTVDATTFGIYVLIWLFCTAIALAATWLFFSFLRHGRRSDT